MTTKEKQLLLCDLCARLPYGIRYKGDGGWPINPYQHTTSLCTILNSEEPLVYLRPMSSMTEEERLVYEQRFHDVGRSIDVIDADDVVSHIDWLLAHHFDFHGLIPMGLALEAQKDMYKTE